jgi:filamentous hemagglutinin
VANLSGGNTAPGALPGTSQATGGSSVALSAPVNLTVPATSLYILHPGPGSGYLIETDPRFANYRSWLSSDYLLTALAYAPASVQKRLGDGFYEQQLIREQIALLTGQRFLQGYDNDEAQYRALMNHGATVAQA